MPNNLQLAS